MAKNTEPICEHLGDGCYVTMEADGGLWVTANHHDLRLATDKVYMEPSILAAFERFLLRAKQEMADRNLTQ